MKLLPLDPTVINGHHQVYPDSCVPMSVELVVKLEDPSQINYYDEQHKYPNGKSWGGDFVRKINRITFTHLFTLPRYTYPLPPLFQTIVDELDSNRYVQLSLVSVWKKDKNGNEVIDNNGHKIPQVFHCWVVYGYDNNGDFLGISRDYNINQPIYIQTGYNPTIKQQLTIMGGTDILIYR
jgi:hypothetical protein